MAVMLMCLWVTPLFANVSAQKMRMDLSVENKSLVEVMDLLKEKTGYSFVYSASDVEDVRGLTHNFKDMTVEEILDILLKDTGLSYKIEDDLIILKKIPTVAAQTQRRVVKGVVLGETERDTLPGVNVMVKGTTSGVMTDLHGKFSIAIPDGEVTLVFSFVGMQTQEVKYTGQEFVRVMMKNETQELEEVTVNAGYLQIDKRQVTSAIQVIKMDDIMAPGISTLDEMLEGAVPGMTFMQNSGQVGATPRLRIRGTSTVLGSQEPLWVVDGIIVEEPVNVDASQLNDLDFVNLLGNAISGLNPSDIEEISVLKDAAATALYGTQAANGVIVITTRKGKAGPPRVTYGFSGTYSRRTRYGDKEINVMNSAERVDFSRDLIAKRMTYPSSGLVWTGYEAAYEAYRNGQLSFEEFNAEVERYETMNTDWLDLLMRDAFSHNHTLSFSGGSENATYYTSIGYTKENGTLRKEDGERYTANTNVTLRFNRFSGQFRLSGYIRDDYHTPSEVGLTDYAYNASRAIEAFNEDGSLYYYAKPGNVNSGTTYWFNILNERDNSYQRIKSNSLSFSASLNYDVIKNLKLMLTGSYTISNTNEDIWFGENTHHVKDISNVQDHMDDMDGDLEPSISIGYWKLNTVFPYGDELQKDETRNENWMVRLQGQYHFWLDKEDHNHMVSMMAGTEMTSSHYTGLSKTFRCYEPDRGLLLGNVDIEEYPEYGRWLAENQDALGTLKDQLNNQISAYGSVNYSWKDIYIFNANMRVDYSNKFGDRSREKFLPIWSVSARWNAKDDVLENVYWVNDLSLRGSFGYQGSVNDQQTPELVINRGYLDLAYNEYGSTIVNFPNPDLAWEKTMSVNAQLDFSLFRNAISGSLSYFYKKTKDAFLTTKVAQVNGTTSYSVNKGTIINQGVEVGLQIQPVNTAVGGSRKGFSWRIDPNLGQVVNQLLNRVLESNQEDPLHDDYTYTDYLNGNAYVDGKPMNSFFSYEFTGLSETDGRPNFARVGEEYFEKYVDMTNAEVYMEVMKYSGCRVPYLQGGINNTFSWNGFVLNFNLAYSIGSKIRLLKLYDPSARSMAVSPQQNLRKEMVDHWQAPGDEKYTNIPGLLNQADYKETQNPWWDGEPFDFGQNIWEMYNYSDIRVVSGNYLKLQRLNLRYVFPEKLCTRMGVKDMYMSLSGTNLFVWSAKELKGQDPSTQSGSATNITVPNPSTYTISLNVTF